MQEEEWVAKRASLRKLLAENPELTNKQLAEQLHCSKDWIKKWKKRLKSANGEDDKILFSRSRAPLHPPARISQKVVEKILEIRDHPPANLQRVPGPLAIKYYLEQDLELKASPARLPHSTATIWRILKANGRIVAPSVRHPQPLERAEPMTEWQIDFKDLGLKPNPDEAGKKQHLVETLNLVDAGTSILIEGVVREDFKEARVIEALSEVLSANGLPKAIRFDRDTRFVGTHSNQDYPSAFVRYLQCVGIEPIICPPHRPDLNCFVERLNRSYSHECLKVFKPQDSGQGREFTATWKQHYNFERPNQALTCGNRPPRVAFGELPALAALPLMVDPDRWLARLEGSYFSRKVRSSGKVSVDRWDYYIQSQLAGQPVALKVDVKAKEFVVYHGQHLLKRLAIKGLHRQEMGYQQYLELICKEARTEQQHKLKC